jgi:excinuclease ABC subunit A
LKTCSQTAKHLIEAFTYPENVFVLIDRFIAKEELDEDDEHRLGDSIGTAFYEGEGDVYLEVDGSQAPAAFQQPFELDGLQFEEPVPNLFSFNNPLGACPCEGFQPGIGD